MKTPITVMALAILAFSSCKVKSDLDTTATPIVFSTALQDAGGSVTKSGTQPGSQTGTVQTFNNEKLGVYVTKHSAGTPQPIGVNVYSNILFDVSSAGVTSPEKPLYYPSSTEKVTAYGYFPYQAVAYTNPNQIAWTVKTAQSTAADVKAADFLWAKAEGNATAASTPIDLSFTHAMALLQINLTIPLEFVDEEIKDLTAHKILQAATKCDINLSTQAVSNVTTKVDVTPRLIGVTSPDADTKMYTYECVVPPQTFAASVDMFNVTMNFTNSGAASRNFKYIPVAALVLGSNSFHTINLALNDYGKLELTGATVGDWTTTAVSGSFGGGGVSNRFDFRLVNLNRDYSAEIDNAKVTIDGTVYTFAKSKLTIVGGGKNSTTVQMSFPDDAGKVPATYPFMVTKVEFFKAGAVSLITQLFATEVTAGGDVVIPWYPYTVFNPSGGVNNWTPLSGGANHKVAIENDFTFMYCNKAATAAQHCSSVNKARLTFSTGETAEFTIAMSGNRYAAQTATTYRFSGTGAVVRYPYTITKVEYLIGATVVKTDATSRMVTNDKGFAIAVVD